MLGQVARHSGRRHCPSGLACCASGWHSQLQGKGPNPGLEPTVPRVTLPAQERNPRATRPAAQPDR